MNNNNNLGLYISIYVLYLKVVLKWFLLKYQTKNIMYFN